VTRTSPAQRSFSSGEIDPLLHRRSDYLRFQSGLSRCRGFLPLPQGGITRAPGTIYRGRTRNDAAGILIPFQFAANDALVLEFVPNWMRVWRYGELVMDGASPYRLATPYGAEDLPNLQWVQSADVIYLVDGAHPMKRLSRLALDDWTIEDQELNRGPFRVQNTVESRTLQASGETGSITLTASWSFFTADHVGSLIRMTPTDETDVALWVSNTDWSVGERCIYDGKTYELIEGTNTGQNPPVHSSGDSRTGEFEVWRFISDRVGVLRITSITSDTVAVAQVVKRLPSSVVASSTYRWSEGAWSARHGYPSAIELFDQRLVAASSTREPRTIWFSGVGSYADFLDGTDPDNPFAYTIAGTSSINRILNLKRGAAGLHIFALGEEFATRSETRAQAIGPTTAVFETIGSAGSNGGRPICPDGDPIFITRDERRLMLQKFTLQEDRTRGSSLSRPAQHIGSDRFQDLVWQSSPEPTAWVRQASGNLAAMIYDPAEEVLGWSVVPVAGGVVEAMAVVPDVTGSMDVVMMIVRRVIEGQTRRFVEEMSLPFTAMDPDASAHEANHLFAALRVSVETPVSEILVPHLAGETVHVWSNEGAFPDLTVTMDEAGTLELPAAVTHAWVGLFDATHELITLDVQAASPNGDTTGRQKRLKDIAVSFARTAQARTAVVEVEPQRRTELRERPLIQMPVAAPLTEVISGVVNTGGVSGTARELQVVVRPFSGAPVTITSIVPVVEEAGR
jgi:hypothetical protein